MRTKMRPGVMGQLVVGTALSAAVCVFLQFKAPLQESIYLKMREPTDVKINPMPSADTNRTPMGSDSLENKMARVRGAAGVVKKQPVPDSLQDQTKLVILRFNLERRLKRLENSTLNWTDSLNSQRYALVHAEDSSLDVITALLKLRESQLHDMGLGTVRTLLELSDLYRFLGNMTEAGGPLNSALNQIQNLENGNRMLIGTIWDELRNADQALLELDSARAAGCAPPPVPAQTRRREGRR